MAKLYAVTQDGDELLLQGKEKHVKDLFGKISQQTPSNIATYHYMWWVDDTGNKRDALCNLNKDAAVRGFDNIRKILKKNHEPLYGIEDWLVCHITGVAPEQFKALCLAWIAFRITEKQGGCWVFE